MTLFGMGDPRPIHFMGIGGAGMSGLALLAKHQGLAITGCDNDPSGAADLAAVGVEIWRGHDPEHVANARAVVVTAAVAGTHGKTTTTVMVTEALAAAGRNPTGLAGGRVALWAGNVRIGGRELFVVEADEFDRAFLALTPTVAV